MCTDLASLNKGLIPKGTVPKSKERMLKYKKFSVAFSYPGAEFITFFPQQKDTEELSFEYDRLFRNNEVWLYGSEYKVENEFQRAQDLADINGFYRAFGLETNLDRPDALACFLEFMHYLIFKELYAKKSNHPDAHQRITICQDAQKKFFQAHLYPDAKSIAQKILSLKLTNFYSKIAQDLLSFLESESVYFKGTKE